MTTSKTLALVLLPVFAFCTACKKKQTSVVIDDSWNVDFAKKECELRARSDDPCVGDPVVEVREFEAKLRTSFASDASCHGIVLAGFGLNQFATKAASEANSSKADWRLMLDFRLGDSSQDWTMVHRGQIAAGRGVPKEIMHAVCRIVKQAGGSLAK
jgi:hypothetical protein